ncbi:MAG: glycosyltransferase family 4 protein [Phormidesmis sp.]
MHFPQVYKLAILNNLVAPYRIPIYRGLGKHFETHLLLSGEESNRDSWQHLDKYLLNVKVRRVWGFTLKFCEKRNGETFDPRYLHINPGYFWSLLKLCPDVVISAEMGFRSIIALLYGFLFRKPVWILWGGTPHTERNRSYFKKLVRRLIFTRVTRWISYGKTTTDYLLELGINRNHILQIQNCVDEKLFMLDDVDVELDRSPFPTLLYAGQLIKRKGPDLFLKAAAKLQQEGYQFSTRIVGSGIEQKKIVNLISQLGLKNVSVLSSQKPEDMPAIYKSADVFVFPTLEEVWGLVVNEALWSGLTVVASIYAGCAEEVLPPDNLFDPLDQQSTINVLKKAINGELPAPSTSQLYTCDQVIELIVSEIKNHFCADKKPVVSSFTVDT